MTAIQDPIVIGVGGNIGTDAEIVDRFRIARMAIEALGDVRSAPLYRTAPLGPAQPAFLNTALRVRIADALPAALIATLLEIERLLGRDRTREARWGPRPIDLDILIWGARVIRTPELEVPHPRLVERRFALAPLADLLPDGEVPGHGPIARLLDRVGDQSIEHVASTW